MPKKISIAAGLGFAAALALLASPQAPGRTFRVAVASFSHETCTFCPDPTTVADWEFSGLPTREVFRDGEGYISGFKRMSDDLGGIDLVGITSPRGSRGGSSGSWLTRESFEKYSGLIVEDLRRLGPFDGVFLALHGAMAVTGIPKPEAELCRRVRAVVGKAPIMVTLDLHANEDRELAEAADAVFIIKRYPHYDTDLQGERAARVMAQTLRGQYKPVMAVRKPKVITPSVFQGTGTSPSMEIMERARIWEEEYPGTYVSVAYGFAYADVPDAGASIMVVANGNKALADRIADDMNDFIWRKREAFAGKKIPKVEEGVARAIAAARAKETPVIVADHSDRTGGSTWILEELIRQKAARFCITTLRDEKALAALRGKKAGESVTLSLGGYSDKYAGNPVKVTATIEKIAGSERDPTAVLKFGDGNRIILTPVLNQVTSAGIFDRLGIPLKEIDIIVLKSRVHFRRGFVDTGIAGAVIEVDAPGWGPADLSELPYKNVPRDLYPLSLEKK